MVDDRVQVTLRRHLDSARVARSHLRRFCAAMSEHVSATAELLTSELVTNAVMHGEGTIELTARIDDEILRVDVFDESIRLPHAVTTEASQAGGDGLDQHGIAIIDSLALAWGTTTRPDREGKYVWFQLRTR